ncbi:hypothetical protein JXA32_10210 [Candidatus Sumerlaeota bacterium]|nr:hypothetical protein [Candidatus Sumerlaeota bacterium]
MLMQSKRNCQGITTIDALIIILLIAIVLAIAVPNFLEFKADFNVSRVKSDMRAIATALEAYYVDNSAYPLMASGAEGENWRAKEKSGAYRICTFRRADQFAAGLTTPIAYLFDYPLDPAADSENTTYGYRAYQNGWALISFGRDRDENAKPHPGDHNNTVCVADIDPVTGADRNFEPSFRLNVTQPSPEYLTAVGSLSGNALHFDPTNGAESEGDIVRSFVRVIEEQGNVKAESRSSMSTESFSFVNPEDFINTEN